MPASTPKIHLTKTSILAAAPGEHIDDTTPYLRLAERLWEGVKGGTNRMLVGAMDVSSPTTGRRAVSSPEAIAAEAKPYRDDLADYERRLASGELGTAAPTCPARPNLNMSISPALHGR
ncbi:hypothetical protein ACIPRI_24740 [Variovorax sp. LARHSF232]